ncbi:MAG: hypothetical protein JWO53_902 [Chlamydiia bacterium]|nr:hypothetical protein [Chlamydiia bacterium]
MDVIIITGCSGRIGQAIIEKAPHTNITFIGFDIAAPKFATGKNFEFIKVDLTSDESVHSAMKQVRAKHGSRITSIIHLAAYYSFSGGAWEMYDKLTLQGTKRLLQEAKNFETEQFLFSSSMLAQAPCQKGEKITEESPMIENWNYPKSKVLAEALIHREHGNIPTVILRIAGCYDDGCHSIPISNQIQRIYEHQLVSRFFPGDLSHGATYIHLADLSECIWKCIEHRKKLPQETTLLVGEEKMLSYDELQRKISYLLTGKQMKTFRIPKLLAKIGAWMQNALPFMPKTFIKPWMIDIADFNYDLDMSHTEKMLGWKPKRELAKVLPLMTKSLQNDPARWYADNGLEMPCSKKACCGGK